MVFFAQKRLVFGPREGVKYYFADFIRKGGTPPPLFGQNFRQKKLRIWGVLPPPPLQTFRRKNFKVVFDLAPKYLQQCRHLQGVSTCAAVITCNGESTFAVVLILEIVKQCGQVARINPGIWGKSPG